MAKLKSIPMNYEHNKLGYGQKLPGKFRDELLEKGITSTFEAIKCGLRTATSRAEKYKKDELVIFYKTGGIEKLLCIITCDSYKVNTIKKEEWSKLEGWDIDYFDLNPDVKNKFQFRFKLLQVYKFG